MDEQGAQAAVEENPSVSGDAALVLQQVQDSRADLGREGRSEALSIRHEVQQHLPVPVSLREAVGDVQSVLTHQLLVAKAQGVQLSPDVAGGDVVCQGVGAEFLLEGFPHDFPAAVC